MKCEFEVIKPTDEVLAQAVEAAELMREHTDDEYGVAHSLLYLHQRNKQLEAIVSLVDRYLNFGTPENEHARLMCMLVALHEFEEAAEEEFKLPEN